MHFPPQNFEELTRAPAKPDRSKIPEPKPKDIRIRPISTSKPERMERLEARHKTPIVHNSKMSVSLLLKDSKNSSTAKKPPLSVRPDRQKVESIARNRIASHSPPADGYNTEGTRDDITRTLKKIA